MSEKLSSMAGGARRSQHEKSEMFERIVDAAVKVLARGGFDGLTLRVVALEADIGTATVYSYFDSREQLLAEVVWRALSLPTLRRAGHPPTAETEQTPLTMSTAASMLTPAVVEPDLIDMQQRLTDRIRGRIDAAIGTGSDPFSARRLEKIYVESLVDAAIGYSTRMRGENAPPTIESDPRDR
ncbi:helix-turn-helix domain-containing protein [Nocardia sp. NPDC005978]|uniref:helix-turn-helix domain-containing protein n=1 Tax=Nocardia sp. NPDC005978 TaxID=3156725 RepID=UPI0033A08899